MYIHEKPRPIDFYKDDTPQPPPSTTTTTATGPDLTRDNMIIEVAAAENGELQPPPPPPHHHRQLLHHHHPQQKQQQQMVLGDSSGDDAHEVKAPKKRAETWVQDETRALIALRREMDCLFNTSKSNKHLWDQISSKMREKGFDRSPTMCTDKWRNLLKEFKKAKHHDSGRGSGGGGSAKMSYYKEIQEILKERSKNANAHSHSHVAPKVDNSSSFMQFADKGFEDTSIAFGPVEGVLPSPSDVLPFESAFVGKIYKKLCQGTTEASGRQTLNLERGLDHDGHPLAITAADAVTASGVQPWNWRDTPGNGTENQSYCGRVISVKYMEYTRKIGIDGSADAIKEAIKSAFRLRTKRAFWLEDEDQIVRTLDKEMPLGNYTLHLDEGLAIKVCLYDESDHLPVHTEERIFYTEDDYRDFLNRRGWTGLREFDGYRNIDSMDDLRPGAMYRGIS